jgi:acyl-CoA thioesterase FadM
MSAILQLARRKGHRMNLWLRLIWLLLTTRSRGRLDLPGGVSALPFRVWPHDLDLSAHMNNGRYLALMDLGRTDVMLRSGLWREVWRQKWTPIASAITILFRRELRVLQKLRLETRLVCWDATLVVMEQTFFICGGARDGQVAARALFKGGLYDRTKRAFVPLADLMQAIGVHAESPLPTPEAEAFLHAHDRLKQVSPG